MWVWSGCGRDRIIVYGYTFGALVTCNVTNVRFTDKQVVLEQKAKN